MIDFKKSPKLAIFTYSVLLLSCFVQITLDLGFHAFDSFASHHGMTIFAIGTIIDNWNNLREYFVDSKGSKQ
ncbi:MAG: hypothetical protein CMM25_02215 [Rhodospirillaceae bacterium]|nr:hypothetical protein [Rhodospirillaceae bacterium]